MAEHRPYRPPHASSGDLRRIKALAGTAIALAFVATNSVATQHAAAVLAHSTYLGSELHPDCPRIGRLYLPWEWLVWAARWHSSSATLADLGERACVPPSTRWR